MNNLIDVLVDKYKYEKLGNVLSNRAKSIYESMLPNWLFEYEKDTKLYTVTGEFVSNGFNRIVIGDYGAFIEIENCQINKNSLICPYDQKFRNKKWFNGKYLWYTIEGSLSGIKIYKQERTVSYADYQVGYYYVAVNELTPIKLIEDLF